MSLCQQNADRSGKTQLFRGQSFWFFPRCPPPLPRAGRSAKFPHRTCIKLCYCGTHKKILRRPQGGEQGTRQESTSTYCFVKNYLAAHDALMVSFSRLTTSSTSLRISSTALSAGMPLSHGESTLPNTWKKQPSKRPMTFSSPPPTISPSG